MIVYYSGVEGREDVSSDSPVDEPLANVMTIFENLDQKRGFLGLILSDHFSIQILAQTNGRLRIELLDSLHPGFDTSQADESFGRELIEGVARGEDGMRFTRERLSNWERTDFV